MNKEKSFLKSKSRWDTLANIYKKKPLEIVISTGAPHVYSQYIDFRQKDVVSKLLFNEKTTSLIDFGCGAGRWLNFFSKLDITLLVGLDVSMNMLKLAKKNFENNGQMVFNSSVTNVPFKNNTFDVSFCCYVLQWITEKENFSKSVQEMIRVTKRRGKIIIIESAGNKPSKKEYIIRRNNLEYINEFTYYGAKLNGIYGVRIPHILNIYIFLIRTFLKPFWKQTKPPCNMFHDTEIFWIWLEKKRIYIRYLVEFPLKIFILFMRPLDKIFAPKILKFLSPETVLIFEKL